MINLFEIPSRTESVQRWQGVEMLGKRKNISEHSFQVALYSLILYKEIGGGFYGVIKSDLLHEALVHDIPEIITGDIPVSCKQRMPEMKEILNKLEEAILAEDLKALEINSSHQNTKFIVKVADYLCVRQELDRELQLGNFSQPIVKAKEVVEKIYHHIFFEKFPTVDTELKNIIKSFVDKNFNSLNLDYESKQCGIR